MTDQIEIPAHNIRRELMHIMNYCKEPENPYNTLYALCSRDYSNRFELKPLNEIGNHDHKFFLNGVESDIFLLFLSDETRYGRTTIDFRWRRPKINELLDYLISYNITDKILFDPGIQTNIFVKNNKNSLTIYRDILPMVTETMKHCFFDEPKLVYPNYPIGRMEVNGKVSMNEILSTLSDNGILELEYKSFEISNDLTFNLPKEKQKIPQGFSRLVVGYPEGKHKKDQITPKLKDFKIEYPLVLVRTQYR